MWNDTRTIELVEMLKDKIKQSESVSYLANIISTGSPAVNLFWIKKNEPENFKKIKEIPYWTGLYCIQTYGKCTDRFL